MGNDVFIDIAAGGIGGRSELLYDPQPEFCNMKKYNLQDGGCKPIETVEKISTSEELSEMLSEMKKKYKPFMEDYAPVTDEMNRRIPLNEFVLNGKESVKIPYYGGPVGNAVHTYECEFDVDEFSEDECAYICIGGADYKVYVLLNGRFAGCHEGFFSPFEFEITSLLKMGKNSVEIVLENDFPYGGYNNGKGEVLEGDKLYAATGIGWDDPSLGWHHCPPGMGIYNDVYIEFRKKTHIRDLFVRPVLSENRAEVWIEIENAEYMKKNVSFLISVYGQNFEETVFEKVLFNPSTIRMVGRGDSFTQTIEARSLGKASEIPAQKGTNLYKFSFPMENARIWELDLPWLYQLQAELVYNDEVTDKKSVQFGMREFVQDVCGDMNGMFYLNGRKIRLRGANTMGFEQLDVMRKDFEQLVDDILLAKICNMNFLRITQRPVQDEVYKYCDMLGLMVQTDLPLFGCMRRNKVAEGIRQAEEMERLVRNHPSCVLVSYINEPFPNAKNEPHRHLERIELEGFFSACDYIVRLNNPDRVIKHVDGDYDPPTEGMPDNHCYPTWYNGHGIDIGRLHKGYWLSVKPDWYYGCGEFGTEGLESYEVMKKYYPEDWLSEPFDPGNILFAQTKSMHRFFYDVQDNLEDWIEKSQEYQALGTKLMTEAFRRDRRMVSNAIHLFIDAWPSGWMKTIMDCERNPKKAYFAYRNALEPVFLSLRTDRFTCYAGEDVSVEVLVCNDTNINKENCTVYYELYSSKGMILHGNSPAVLKDCDVTPVADVRFAIPLVEDREEFVLKAVLCDENKNVLSHNSLKIEVFERVNVVENGNVEIITALDEGEYEIAGEKVLVKQCGMLPLHFVSRKTRHKIAEGFRERDFSYWYDKANDMITPILYNTFTAEGFEPILVSENKNKNGIWDEAYAAAIKEYKGKYYVICLADLRSENPVAQRFLRNIYAYAESEHERKNI